MTSACGPLTSGVYQLQRLVAESVAFRGRVGIDEADAAKKRVKVFEYEATPEELRRARPFACVWPGEKLSIHRVGGGANSVYAPSGDLVLIITDNDRHPGDREASAADFIGWVDCILIDLLEAAGVDDRIGIREISLLRHPSRTPTEEEPSAGAFWDVGFIVSWN